MIPETLRIYGRAGETAVREIYMLGSAELIHSLECVDSDSDHLNAKILTEFDADNIEIQVAVIEVGATFDFYADSSVAHIIFTFGGETKESISSAVEIYRDIY